MTLISAGIITDDVPDSAIHRYKLDEGSGTTVADSIGTEDGTKDGATWVSGTWQGGNALDGDGTDDFVDLTTLGTFGSNLTTDFAIGITVDGFSGGSLSTLLMGENSNGTQLRFTLQTDGTIEFILIDDNSDRIDSDFPSNINDSGTHRYLFNKTSNNASGLEIYEDDTALSGTTGATQPFDTTTDFDVQPVSILRRLFSGGANDQYLNALVDDIIIYSDSLTAQEITDDYNLQPWT